MPFVYDFMKFRGWKVYITRQSFDGQTQFLDLLKQECTWVGRNSICRYVHNELPHPKYVGLHLKFIFD